MMTETLAIQTTTLMMTARMIRKKKPKALWLNRAMTASMAKVIITEQDLDGLVVAENTVSAKPHTSNTL